MDIKQTLHEKPSVIYKLQTQILRSRLRLEEINTEIRKMEHDKMVVVTRQAVEENWKPNNEAIRKDYVEKALAKDNEYVNKVKERDSIDADIKNKSLILELEKNLFSSAKALSRLGDLDE